MKRDVAMASEGFRFRLDAHSGVPVYRQLIDQVQGAIATGVLQVGEQLPTVRQVAVELTINPNTVMRAYREMEIRGIVDTQQGTGTFVADKPVETDAGERERRAEQLVAEFISRAGSMGLTVAELIEALTKRAGNADKETESRRNT